MKKLFAALLLMTAVTVAWSQQMTIRSFRQLDSDMTANLKGTSKKDLNGQTAALIKIVTPLTNLSFDGGSLGIVDVVQKTGEVWVYVPRRAQKITIAHTSYGIIRDYFYPVSIDAARTYEMLLDLKGMDVSIVSQVSGSTITIDGIDRGTSPLNVYLPYGVHTIKAKNGYFIGEQNIIVTEGGATSFEIKQEDTSLSIGKVEVSASSTTEIYFNGERKGVGHWSTELPEGQYIIETRREGFEPRQTAFEVIAQKVMEITAKEPVPFTSFLHLTMTPEDADVYSGNRRHSAEALQELSVGHYTFTFRHNGYYPTTKEFDIERFKDTELEVELEAIEYVKPKAIYFGLSYSYASLWGVSLFVGGILKNNDLQIGFTYGLGKSGSITWYDQERQPVNQAYYTANVITAKYGYQFKVSRHIGLTPQVGYALTVFSGHSTDSDEKAICNGASAHSLTGGVKLVYSPTEHFCLFATPEYAYCLKQGDAAKSLAEKGDFKLSGFQAHAGFFIRF